ncbi:nucleotide exchange factor GrpE [Corynebacterium hansenii]|uniref:Protein GrpE n=1 Tax=Corynebacterium hansenii TaxID=394964 RepID=A0ABV7ZPV3_9CORY|nr:nucleotide exchange factor GrpE [Corynebacterium hansenii]WJZ01169.1 heat shock protein GrpE [Corynebacterium hansenii]
MTNPTDNPFDDRGAGPDAGPAEAAAAEGVDDAAFDDAVDADAAAQAEADGAEAGAVDDEATRLRSELDERTEDLQRVSAEFANYRRRVDRDRRLDRELAKASIAGELLNLADDLDRAEQHGDLSAEGPLKAFADKFRNTLDTLKVTAFGAEGEEFDPAIHEAVQDTSNGDEKVIGSVLRKGYRLDERVIRTAMVVIADPA